MSQLHARKLRTIYIAGPISGIPDKNKPSFAAAEERIARHGHKPVNPHKIHNQTEWAPAMRADMAYMMAHCDSLVLIDGWHRSKGAMTELKLAFDLGLEIFPSVNAFILDETT